MDQTLTIIETREEITEIRELDDAGKLIAAREIAYTWKDKTEGNALGEFQVLKSDNAWWMDMGKLERLIAAFKIGCTVKQSCIYANISYEQYRYFNEMHPEFSQLKEAAEEVPTMKAINTLAGDLENPESAKFWLKARDKRFRPGIKVESDLPLAPTTNNLIIASNVDTTKVERLLAAAAERFLADTGGESTTAQGS